MEAVQIRELTVVTDVGQCAGHPLVAVPLSVQLHMLDASGQGQRLPQNRRALRLLECFLQVTGKHLGDDCVRNGELAGLLPLFIGALYSARFVSLTSARRYEYVSTVLAALKGIDPALDQVAQSLKPRPHSPTPEITAQIACFDSFKLNPVAVTIWHGWPIKNLKGKTGWLPLRGVYLKFGATWTQRLYLAVRGWYAGGRGEKIAGLAQFLKFICSDEETTAASLSDPILVGAFWWRFWEYYKTDRGKTTSNRQLLLDWEGEWTKFAKLVLTGPNLLAQSAFPFPGPRTSSERAYSGGSVRGDGDLGILLVEVPPNVTDQAALEHILSEVPKRLETVQLWADHEARVVWERYRARQKLAAIGTPRCVTASSPTNNGEHWKVHWANPAVMANAAATYRQHGYQTATTERRLIQLYPKPINRTATLLGVPVASSLLPFAAQLVLEHPAITPSFLESLCLYDKNGKLSGVRKIDGGWYLVGTKHRKGVDKAEQQIQLNHKSSRVIAQIVAITNDARAFLKQAGDANWRFLFLSTGRGFGYPRPITRFATDTSMPSRLAAIQRSFSAVASLSPADAAELASRFSLKTLRATVGLRAFLKTHSEAAMSEALGHRKFSPRLLSRYLPKELLALFRARWVRMFQLTLLVHVTATTPHQLRATGFRSRAEVDEFLCSTAFPGLGEMLAEVDESPPAKQGSGQFVLEANPQTLKALRDFSSETTSLGCEVAASSGPFWSELARHVLNLLEERRKMNPALDRLMREAEEGGV